MDWIRENKSLAAIVFAGLAGVLGLGFLLYRGYDAYSSSKQMFDSTSGNLARMKSAPLAPTPENLKAKADAVKAYEQVVGKLGTVLLTLQQEDKPISDTDFQAKLKSLIAETKQKANQSRIGLPPEFAFGFDDYTASLPSTSEAASQLSTYLDSVHAVVQLMLDSGVRGIMTLERTPLAVEKGAEKEDPRKRQGQRPPPGRPTPGGTPPPAASKATESRTITVSAELDQVPLQLLMNRLASPSGIPFFTVVRNLRVENVAQIGPLRSEVFVPSGGEGNAGTGVEGEDAPSDGTIRAAEPEAPDSVAVMGNENLRVYMEIDLVRFFPENS